MIYFYLSFLLTMQNAYSFAYSVGSLFTSPFSSQCKMPTPLTILLDLHSVMHSATAESVLTCARADVAPTQFVLSSAARAAADLAAPRPGAQLHCVGVRLGFDTELFVASNLADMYS